MRLFHFFPGLVLAFAFAAPGIAAASSVATRLVEAGIRFEHAEGVNRDFDRAHELYCAAARDENADAMARLGWMYANGRGRPRDDVMAASLFRAAAARGHEGAGRLAQVITATGERLPDCLIARPGVVHAPELVGPPATAAALARPSEPTPSIDSPVQLPTVAASPDRLQLARLVVHLARDYRLDPRLVFAIMRAESNFDPAARSPKGALGLMQLIPDTAERFAVADALDPLQNLRGGMSYLRWLLAYFRGDVVLTLAAYNAGEGAVDRFQGVPPFAETLAYVQRIRALYPHDRHPYDPRLVGASRFLQASPQAGRPLPAVRTF